MELESPDSSTTPPTTSTTPPTTCSFTSSFTISFTSSLLATFTPSLTVSPMAVGVLGREVEGVRGRVEEREEESRVESMEAWESPRVSKKLAPLLGLFLRLRLVVVPPCWRASLLESRSKEVWGWGAFLAAPSRWLRWLPQAPVEGRVAEREVGKVEEGGVMLEMSLQAVSTSPSLDVEVSTPAKEGSSSLSSSSFLPFSSVPPSFAFLICLLRSSSSKNALILAMFL